MTTTMTTTMTTDANRPRPRNLTTTGIFKAGLRLIPAALLFVGVATAAAPVGATGSPCPPPSGSVAVRGGDVAIDASVELSADGGDATAQADGGNRNRATGGAGGGGFFPFFFLPVGDGGDAAAGTGGDAAADADGGTVEVEAISTGDNRGNTITVRTATGSPCPASRGPVRVAGGDVALDASVDLSADGGSASANATGGDRNRVSGGDGGFFGGGGDAKAGTGGDAAARATGGTVTVESITTGNNRGNAIAVGATSGPVAVAGGDVTIDASVAISADGGTATANADGGDRNRASGGDGGFLGSGGDAAAGTGGEADAQATGGTISVGAIDTGGNRGNDITVGATHGPVAVDGGDVTIDSSVTISADGGTADAQATGGDGNRADGGDGGVLGGSGGDASAGNGGTASAEANGGSITVGGIDTGGNSGNDIEVGA